MHPFLDTLVQVGVVTSVYMYVFVIFFPAIHRRNSQLAARQNIRQVHRKVFILARVHNLPLAVGPIAKSSADPWTRQEII